MIDGTIIKAVAGLKARFDGPYSPADCELIKDLYHQLLGKEVRSTTCQNCYHDAVIEMHLFIKRATMKETAQLKAGAVIACPTFHNGTIYTNDNITDDIAREYLDLFPQRSNLFAALPPKAPKAKKEPKAPKAKKEETEK